jgi:phosphoribosylformimino-5-aminoimidazole carboxamide ribonucleotide (ProFAR) isomerase
VAAAKESESGIAGIIVGKALYTGAVDLPAALSAILAVEGA